VQARFVTGFDNFAELELQRVFALVNSEYGHADHDNHRSYKHEQKIHFGAH
jgi:hypothetical protein